VFGWFDHSKIDAFAHEIADEFAHHWPLDQSADDTAAEKKLLHAIEILGNRAAKLNRETPLGWYRKARFLRTIKEDLLARGGAEPLVDRIVYAVVVRMSRRDPARG
jgi:hypothetical protein